VSACNVIAIATGYRHTIALAADKTCWTWGDNQYGELGRTNVSVGYGSYDASPGQIPPSILTNVVAIAAGADFSLAVTSDGYVHAFGDNSAGQLATNPADLPYTNSPMQVAGISNVVLVGAASGDPLSQDSGAEGHVVAMTLEPVDGSGQTTNRYWGWGSNFSGAVGNGTNQNNSGGNNYQTTPAQVQFCTRCQREIQLGTNGTFTAQCNGTLYLYFNDEIGLFDDDAGSFTVTINGVTTNVVALDPSGYGIGVAVGTVTNGGVYPFSAGGTCSWNAFTCANCVADANGNSGTGVWDCSNFSFINKTNAVCPTAQCFSLVGKIQ
jgi:hypothetical protein